MPPPKHVSTTKRPPPRRTGGVAVQEDLLSVDKSWEEHWKGMPEFSQKNLTPFKSIQLHFACHEHMKQFSELVGQNVTTDTRSIWFPKPEIGKIADRRWDEREPDDGSAFSPQAGEVPQELPAETTAEVVAYKSHAHLLEE